MIRLITTVLVTAAVGLQAQQPPVQNGRVETRAGSSVTNVLASLPSGPEAVWIAWHVPMVDGDRSPCSTWSDGQQVIRGEALEPRDLRSAPAQPTATSGPLRLEAGTELTVLGRVVDRALERLRIVGDDCPIDAGGRTVYWLTGITPAESVRYLETLALTDAVNISGNRRLAESAVSALSYHRDAAATAVLQRLTAKDTDRALRRQAATALATTRGAAGVQQVSALIKEERDRDVRQGFVTALAGSPLVAATDLLLSLTRTDPDANVRAEAGYRYIRRAGVAGLPTALALVESSTDDTVKRRIVSGISSLPPAVGAPVLIDLARTNKNLAVRKEAVNALSKSTDAGAVGFLEEIVSRP